MPTSVISYHVQCIGCGAMAFTGDASDPDSLVQCPCCPVDHAHGEAANACPGGHGECTLDKCSVLTPEGVACPGGHCGKGIQGCTSCRPLRITLIGVTSMRQA